MAIDLSLRMDSSEANTAAKGFSATVTEAFKKVAGESDALKAKLGAVTASTKVLSDQAIKSSVEQALLAKGLLGAGAAAQTAGNQFQRLQAGLTSLSQSVVRQSVEQGSLGKAILQTGQAAQTQLNQFQRLQNQYQSTDREAQQFGRGLGIVRTGLASLGVTLGLAGLLQLGRSLVEAGLQMDKFERTLQAATGSAAAGQQAFAFIVAESNRLGQSIQTMIPGFVALTAATRGTTLEGTKTKELFSALAGAGVAVGLSSEATGRALVGLTQIISQNAIQLDEFRNQFASQIPGAMAATARALGEMGVTARGSISEMLQLIEKGKLPVETLMQAVTMGLNEVAAAAPSMADSVEGAFNKFSNDAFQLKADLARSGLLEFLGELAKAGADAMFNAGQALGLAPPNAAREMQQLQKDLALVNSGILEYTAVADRARKQGLVPESELAAIAELTTRRDALTTRLQAYQDQVQATGRAEKIVADARQAERNAANAEEKKFFDERQKREALLKAQPDILQAQMKTRAELINQGEAAVKKGYEQQRVLAAQNLKEELAQTGLTLDQTKALREQYAADVRLLDQQEGAARLDARKKSVDQELTEGQRLITAQIAAAGDAADKIAVLDAQRPALVAKHAADIADIDADRVALQAKSAEAGTKVLGDELEKRLKEEERFADLVQEVQSKHTEWQMREFDRIADANEKLDQQALRETQRALDAQERAYESFAGRVTDFLAGTFEELMRGTLSAVDFFRNILIRSLANIAANVISPFIAAISSSLIGGIANMLPQLLGSAVLTSAGLTGAVAGPGGATGSGGLLETGGTALTGIALAKQLYSYLGIDTLVNYVGSGFNTLSQAVLGGIDTVFSTSLSAANQATQMSATLAAEELSGGFATGASDAASGVGSMAGIAGGALAIAGGIYGALNATNTASKAAYAASAAAGAAALASTALVAAGVIAATTGWTGIGLIAAAVLAIVGTITEMVLKPAGPALAVGKVQGLNIGVADGQLQAQGDLTSSVLRREGVDKGMASGVQAQLEEGITAAVVGIVQTINAVALDPTALVGPTQEALQTALRNLKPINSANAKKLEGDMKDITEQLRFASVAIVGGMLEPLNLAFDQLRDTSDVKKQLERLPGTTKGLVDIFKTMNQQLDEIGKSENTDVLRQISGVRNQVENFGNRIAGTAAQTAESIVTSILKSFDAAMPGGAFGFTGGAVGEEISFDATGAAIQRWDMTLAEQITQFSELMNDAFGALAGLRTTQQTLEGAGLSGSGVGAQIDRLTEAMGRAAETMASEIVTTALQGISADLQQVLVQPLKVQATTVNSLFNDALASLSALGQQWSAFSAAGLDTTKIQEQFTRLLSGILDTTTQVLDNALTKGTFSEFLGVLLSIPKAVTDLNPAFAKLRAIGEAFATVVGPIAQAIATLEDAMRTTAEKVTFTAERMTDLRAAIAAAGDSADQALPLYAQLSQAVLANAELQIQMIKEIAQAWEQAMNQVQSDIDSLESSLGSLSNQLDRAVSNMITSANDFNVAAASGDTLAAIEAIQVYEQSLVTLAELQIQQVQAHRQATIDAQQAIIDGIQGQVDAQQQVIDAIQDEADAQQKVIDGTQQLIDAQQGVIDAIHDQMDAQQEVIDAIQDQIDAQQKVIDGTQKQIDAQQKVINGTQKQIDAVNDSVRAQQEYIDSLQDEVKARQEAVDSLVREIVTLRQLRDRVGDLTRAGLSPARQAPAIREEMAATRARLMTSGGDDAIKELEKLISLNEELKQLGEQTDQLVLIKEALDNLNILQGELTAQLGVKEGELPIAQQQLDAANAAVAAATLQLDALNAQLDTLNAQLEFEQAQLDGINAQLEFERAQLDALVDQKTVQEDVLKAIADQLKPAEAQLSALNAQLEFDRAQLDAINARITLEQAALTTLTDQLKEQQDILAEIEKSTYWDEQIATINTVLLTELNNVKKWLSGVEGYTTWEDQIIAIQNESVAQLRQIESDLKYLFLQTVASSGAAGISIGLQQRMVGALDTLTTYNLALPVKTQVTNFYEAPRQRGGLLGIASGQYYAQGGMVPTMLEPGERVLLGPLTHAQQGAAAAWNQAWPRFASGGFTVPGSGTGDSVPMMLPGGSFILNRNAAGTLGRQDGGTVQPSSQGNGGGKTEIHHHHYDQRVDLRGSHFSDHEDLKRLQRMLEEIRRKRGDSRL